jgi:uncharacterized damage-inducible protein DinB
VKDLLTSYLGAQRRHVLGILEDLEDADLRRPVLPSGWSCLGLVQHLAVDVERFWFGAVVGGDPDVIAGLAPTDAWAVDPDIPAADVLELYRREIALADTVIAAASLDAAPAWWPEELFGDWRLDDVADALLHVITETASHAGHLDAARELIDGRQWVVLD